MTDTNNGFVNRRLNSQVNDFNSKILNEVLLDSPVALAIVHGSEWTFSFANPAFTKFFSSNSEALVGKSLSALFPEASSSGLHQMVKNVSSTGEPFSIASYPVELAGQNQSRSYFNFDIRPIKNEAGQVADIAIHAYEVTRMTESHQQVTESEGKYRSILDGMGQGFCIIKMIFDENGKPVDYLFTEINPLFEEQTGLRDATGKTAKQLVPTLEDKWFQLYGNVALTGKSARFIEGSIPMGRMFEVHAFRIGDNDSTHVAIIFNDVTKSRKAEIALQDSETRFRALVTATSDAVYRMNPDWTEMRNLEGRGFLSDTGQPISAWLEKYIHPKDQQKVREAIAKSVRNKSVFEMEHQVLTADGTLGWTFSRAIPILDEDDNIIEWFGAASDVTERKLIEHSLSESEERFRTIADVTPNMVWSINGDGSTKYVNRYALDYFGKTVDSFPSNWGELIHPDDIAYVNGIVTEALEKRIPYRMEFRLRRFDGAYRYFVCSAAPAFLADGTLYGYIGTTVDINEIREAQLRVSESEARYKSLSESLEQQVQQRTAELQRSNDDLQQFAHVASHDLKEPVRKIKTFSERLKDEIDNNISDRGKLFLQKIDSASDRMFAMIEGVLIYSSINAGVQHLESINLNDTIKNIELDLEVMIQKQKAQILYEDLPTIQGAPVLIYQLFYNLINNSLKFARRDTSSVIAISVHPILFNDQDFVEIAVRDNGIGFEGDQSLKIFDTFTRLNSKDQYEGTGLGLALCKKIAERHGGSVQARGIPGIGAEFIVKLPILQGRVSI